MQSGRRFLSLIVHTAVFTRLGEPGLQIKSIYYPEIEQVIKDATGASRVHVFDHTLRKGTIKEAK